MLEFDQPEALRTWLKERRSAGQRIGFVPTMGYLHEGHLSLIERASAKSDIVVLSVFVNPLQFGPGEDLERYPRDLPRDRGLAESRGVAALFVPSAATMYPPGAEVRVVPGDAASRWEGAVRPGHFTGVLTVVAKLFHLVGPDIAFFGQKDVQQAVLIRGMVRDLDWPIEIEVAPTVRNRDGLALSSRNVYLDPTAREQALGLSRALARAHQRFRDGVRAAADLRATMDEVLRVYPALAVEYIAIVDSDRMQPIEQVDATTIVALAARVGATRLIDNIVLGKGL
ncbi:MAG TPA: pantoate--beta-alanine ligase [Gemmatimonadales bacterium]|jgi:pantoate--beta-alanine ligase|nr:pantoate--beta-alanine ligase [Gemmatimonadales bacterium]